MLTVKEKNRIQDLEQRGLAYHPDHFDEWMTLSCKRSWTAEDHIAEENDVENRVPAMIETSLGELHYSFLQGATLGFKDAVASGDLEEVKEALCGVQSALSVIIVAYGLASNWDETFAEFLKISEKKSGSA